MNASTEPHESQHRTTTVHQGRARPAVARPRSPLPAARRAAQRGGGATPPKFGKDALKCAEQIDGLHFTDAEEEMALAGVSRNLDSYEQLRKLDVPLDTEPAITFRPYLPGKQPQPAGPRAMPQCDRGRDAARCRVHIASLDDLAFEPVTVARGARSRAGKSRRPTSRRCTSRGSSATASSSTASSRSPRISRSRRRPQADRRSKAGTYRGPLHGIPWGAKDLFATKGIRTTWGAKPYENQVIDQSTRRSSSGCAKPAPCSCAKLSMGALAQGGVWFGGIDAQSVDRPTTARADRRPAPAPRPPPASSASRSAPRRAARSSRPRRTCGVVGLRPTYGRVSRYGAMALSWTMDKIGPMCRSVEDCALVFNAIYGADGRDDTVVDAPFDWNPDVPLVEPEDRLRRERVRRDRRRGGGGGGRGGANPEDARRRAEERNTLLKDALDVLRARRREARADRRCPTSRPTRSASSSAPRRPRPSTT